MQEEVSPTPRASEAPVLWESLNTKLIGMWSNQEVINAMQQSWFNTEPVGFTPWFQSSSKIRVKNREPVPVYHHPMAMDGHDSEVDGSMSNNDEELSDLHDDDSDEHLPRAAEGEDTDSLSKLKQHVRDVDRVLDGHPPQHAFSLPLPFPFPHPVSAFMPPLPPYPAPPPHNSSGSSHSSEGSNSSQQHTWSFEEQFKQVRQLYEISDDPKRKEFLDDLFTFMQKRGTPINRLPIMAKSVLDLYELYNLVIARGGLVDVINKKLWQEIIKGLHLPSSITSAAFTLRTQYMKYLYPYECEKRRLSTPSELQAAIDGNRREGRRTSYSGYPDLMRRSPGPPMPPQMSPLSHLRANLNGNGHLPHAALHPSLAQPPLAAMPMSGFGDFESRMAEYVRMLNKELRSTVGASPPLKPAIHSPPSPPTSTSPREALSALEMSRLTLWNLYNNNHQPTTPEPQKEALNLGVKDDVNKSQTTQNIKRESPEIAPVGPPIKKAMMDDEPSKDGERGNNGMHIQVTSRGDSRDQDGSLVVSMEFNGTMYKGVLFAQSSVH